MHKVLFLDRDGVINVDSKYTYMPSDLHFVDGIQTLIKKAKLKDYYVICITNQSGIARGLFNENDFHTFMKYLNNRLKISIGFELDAYYFCPHHPSGTVKEYSLECKCRKPEIGLFQLAANDFEIDFANSIFIGDKLTDLIAAESMNIKNLFLYTKNKNISFPSKYTSIKELHNLNFLFD